MIIKSMSRKAPTFGQLIDYIGRNSDPQTGSVFARNLYHSGHDTHAVVGQFLDNYRYLPKRKNGNALYHEVIVLERQEHLTKTQIEAALHQLAEEYCTKRAPHQLVWGRVHWDTDYPHIHLMISSNAVRSDRRVRMEKGQFSQIQKSLEGYKAQNFPELNGEKVYQKDLKPERLKLARQEGEMIRRTGRSSSKQDVSNLINEALENSAGRNQIETNLHMAGFDLYQRGQSIGVVHLTTGRKYRLRTLGLEAAFHTAISRTPKKPRDETHPKPVPERSSAPSRKPPDTITKAKPADPRAEALKANRTSFHAQARDLLDGFERDEENER